MPSDAGVRAAVASQPILARLLSLGAEYPVLNMQIILASVPGPLKVSYSTRSSINLLCYLFVGNNLLISRFRVQQTSIIRRVGQNRMRINTPYICTAYIDAVYFSWLTVSVSVYSIYTFWGLYIYEYSIYSIYTNNSVFIRV